MKDNIVKIKNWILDKWLAGFLTATFFFFVKLYVDLPIEKKGSFITFSWLGYLMETKFELWKILVLALVLLIIYKLKTHVSQNKNNQEKIPDKIKTYTQDTFGPYNNIWVWQYGWNKYGKYLPSAISPCCPVCSNIMIKYLNMNQAVCTKCRLEGKKHDYKTDDENDIQHEIIRRIHAKLNTK